MPGRAYVLRGRSISNIHALTAITLDQNGTDYGRGQASSGRRVLFGEVEQMLATGYVMPPRCWAAFDGGVISHDASRCYSNTQAKLSQQLAHQFASSPFMGNSDPLFPRRWAMHGCTRWTLKSCVDFLPEFESLSGVPARAANFSSCLGRVGIITR